MRSIHSLSNSIVLLLVPLLALGDEQTSPHPESLIELLRKGDYVERQRALDALAAVPSGTEKYVAVLRPALQDKDRDVRQQAAMALAVFGIDETPVLEELLAGMTRRHPGRYHSQPEDARSAMAALVKLGRKAVPSLVNAFDDESYVGRMLALEALGEIGPPAKDGLPVIEKALAKQDCEALVKLVEAKWQIDRDAVYALKQLLPLLEDKRNLTCDGVLKTLAHMGPDAKEAMPALCAAVKRFKEHNVLWAIGRLAPHARELALPALREALQEPTLADDAAIALKGLGVPANEIVPDQLRRLRACKPGDKNEPKRIVYTIVIYDTNAKRYTQDLIRLLNHENPEVRRGAAWGLCRVGGDEAEVAAALNKALEDPEVAEEAAKSLELLSR